MARAILGKVMWVGRATVFLVGLSVILAVIFGVASTALAHKADRGLFHLGHTNAGKALSTLVGTLATPVLKVDNNGTGPALQLEAGNAAGAEPGTVAPISVNPEAGTATGLSADELDGRDSSQFADSAHAHSGADITSGTVAEGRIDGAVARDSEVMNTVKANDGPGSGLDADTLDGQHSGAFAPSTHNHDDRYLTEWESDGRFVAYKRTVVVSPVGTDSENGQALRNALLRITDASATKRYLLQVEAGTYDLGGGYDTSTLVMKEHVDIQGAGELGTVITSRSPLTVKGASKAELRFLAVRNTLPSSRAIAIYNDSASPRLTRVTAESIGAGGSENIGVYNYNSSSPTMTDVTATASGATSNYGVYSVDSSPTIKHSRLSGSTRSLFHGSPTGITRVALTELVGPILGSSGNLRCFDNYDQDLAPVICP